MIGVRSLIPLLAALPMVAVGCGGGGASTTGEAPADRGAADGLLLVAGDLPDGATAEPGPPAEPCGPLPILERDGAEAAASPLFGIGQARVKEAVGVFANARLAAVAYGELDAERRRECIRTALAGFSGEGSLVALPPRGLGLGAESSLARFRESGSESPRAVDVISIRSGRCVAALILQGDGDTATLAREVAVAAARSLTGPCE